jgi:23S rRNA (cytosine1962-C5)-methyltransferase
MNPLLQSRAKGGVGGFSILDLFCYQGWFACHAASQIDAVTSVDSSGDAVAAARINAELNNHKNINFVRADAFDFLSESQDKFDLVHLDPPPFAKEKSNLQPAIAGYKKLADAALRHLKDNGILFISSCSHHVTEGILEKTLDESLKKNNRKYNVIFRGIQDRDHPVLKGFPESLYLKAIAVKLI